MFCPELLFPNPSQPSPLLLDVPLFVDPVDPDDDPEVVEPLPVSVGLFKLVELELADP